MLLTSSALRSSRQRVPIAIRSVVLSSASTPLPLHTFASPLVASRSHRSDSSDSTIPRFSSTYINQASPRARSSYPTRLSTRYCIQHLMPPSHAALSIMAPKQATLGKFFGQQNGAKPTPKQQSTLAFSKKTEVKKEEEAGESPESNDASMEDVKAAKVEPEDEDVTSSPPSTSLKRTTIEDDDDESEEEPPSKKQRKKPQEPEQKSLTNGHSKTHDALAATASPVSKVKVESATQEQPVDLQTSSVASASDIDEDVDASEVESEAETATVANPSRKETKGSKSSAKQQSVLILSEAKNAFPDWNQGEPVPYAALCTTFSKIELTTKRLEITAHCSLFLRQVLRLTPQDLLPTMLLMINKLAAEHEGIELGIGESAIMKAIGESTGRTMAIIKADQKAIGDLGLVAAKSRGNQPTMFQPKPLTVRGVHEGLMAIASTSEGQGAVSRRIGSIKKLLSSADSSAATKARKGVDITQDKGGPSEAKYIVRHLEGKLRIGLAGQTVLVSLAHAMVHHDAEQVKKGSVPSAEQLTKGEALLKSVYTELPDYSVIIPILLEHGIWELRENCKLRPGVPLKPMLARPTKSITEVLNRFEGKEFTCEYKYDGERAQIHFVAHSAAEDFKAKVPIEGKSDRGIANIFSRNSEDLSKKYPDILEKLPTWVKEGTQSFVVDCETVAWDMDEKKVLPFQQLMTRKRKDVKTEDIKVKVCVFAFDLLYINGEAIVTKPFRERRKLLHDSFAEVPGEFKFAQYGDADQLDEIQTLLDASVKASCEGLMVKMLDGPGSNYEPSKRSQNWLKVKKDYLAGVGDSLDLVVLGAYFGKGKRTSVYGAFLLACWNASRERYETVCNIGTGFSDENLELFHSQLSKITIDQPKPFYEHSTGTNDQPDVWFEPRIVWEVKAADLTLSPRYRAAAQEMPGGKGVSLRFPRFVRVREDKGTEDATESRRVADMYRRQESVAKNAGPSADDEFEY